MLAFVAIGITVAVYGVVALIVKADDAGMALATNAVPRRSAVRSAGAWCGHARISETPQRDRHRRHDLGRRRIILHGVEVYGPPAIGHAVKAAAEAVAHAVPPIAGILEWVVEAAISGLIGLLVGAASIPVVGLVVAPAWKWLKRFLHRRGIRPSLEGSTAKVGLINLRIAGPSVSMSATTLGTIEHGARES